MPSPGFPLGQNDNDRIRFNESTQIWERGAGGAGDAAFEISYQWAATDTTFTANGEVFPVWGQPGTSRPAIDTISQIVMPDSGHVPRVMVFASKELASFRLGVYQNGVLVSLVSQNVPANTPTAFDYGVAAAFVSGGRISLGLENSQTVAELEFNLNLLIALDGNF